MTDGNDAAFASSFNHGMTKREYFAAMAMQAIITNSDYGNSWAEDTDYAVKVADALIEALNKNTGENT